MLSIALIGPVGRLGRAIAQEIAVTADMKLTGGVVRSDTDHEGQDLGVLLSGMPINIATTVSLEEGISGADVVIDASIPEMTLAAAEHLAEAGGPPLITGVTGFDPDEETRLLALTSRLPILKAGNFSLGVAIAEALVGEAAALPASDWDIEIEEAHHREKVDAPSGTALMLGRAAARTRGVTLGDVSVEARQGRTGPRPDGAIGFSVTRGGAILGEHAVRFMSDMEELAISHRAYDRRVFARGALAAASWMKDKPAGLYAMRDVITG